MYNVRQWERFQFLMDYEHKQVFFTPDQLGYFLGPKVLFFSAQEDSAQDSSRCVEAFDCPQD